MNAYQAVREQIRKMIDGTGGTYEWDDHMYVHKNRGKAANALIVLADSAPKWFPPGPKGGFCSEEGIQYLRLLLDATSNVTVDQAG